MAAVQLHKLAFHKLGGVVVPGNAERLSRCAYRFKYEVNDFVQAVFIHVRVLNENVILDIFLDDFPIYLYCALRFRFCSFPFRLCRVPVERQGI